MRHMRAALGPQGQTHEHLSFVASLARIAQLVEHTTDTGGVLGSNPSARTVDLFLVSEK